MSERHPVMAPEDIPDIAVGSMNDTHHEEVALVNALGRLLLQAREGNPDKEAIGKALDDWIRHTESHFERENRLMQEYGFPPFPVHAGEHSNALENLHRLQQNWHSDQDLDALGGYVFNTWPQWFQMHVNSMDNVTAQFLSNFVD
ncbi:bacteriohemerythrin [Thiolapillus sp.]